MSISNNLKRSATPSFEDTSSKSARIEAFATLPEDIQLKVTSILNEAKNSRAELRNYFRVVEDSARQPLYIVREKNGVIELGLVEKKLGAGGIGCVYKVSMLETGQTVALKMAPIILNYHHEACYQDKELVQIECKIVDDVIAKINPDGAIRGLPKPLLESCVLANAANKNNPHMEDVVGFLMELADHDYHKQAEYNKKTLFFARIGEEFKDIANGIAKLNQTHMHGDIKPANIVCKSGRAMVVDFGKVRELSTLWNRIDDDTDHSNVPREDSDRFNSLPAIIESDKGDLLEKARRKLKKAMGKEDLYAIFQLRKNVHALEQEIAELKEECPMLGKAMDVFGAGLAFFKRCYDQAPYERIGSLDNAIVFKKEGDKLIPLRPRQVKTVKLPSGLKELMEQMLDPYPKNRPSAEEVLNRLEQIFPELDPSDPLWDLALWNG